MTEENNSDRELIVSIQNLNFTFAKADEAILKDISLEIAHGEFVILVGPSGSGKSTLVNCLNGIIPHFSRGMMTGHVKIAGLDVHQVKVHDLAQHVGSVFQDPSSQIFSLTVQDEVAFGPENLGYTRPEIVRAVEEALEMTGMLPLKDAATAILSGGQLQKTAIASALSKRSALLVMDEPTTDLDPVSTSQVIEEIKDLRQRLGLTFVVVEHDIDELVGLANRVVLLDQGRIILDSPVDEAFDKHFDTFKELGIRLPEHIEMGHLLRKKGYRVSDVPVSIAEASELLEKIGPKLQWRQHEQVNRPIKSDDAEPILKIAGLHVSYGNRPDVLKGIDLEVYPGDFIAVIGPNGSGKSTLAKAAIGLIKPKRGNVVVCGLDTRKAKLNAITALVGFCFQNPDVQLFTHEVGEELAFGLRERDVPDQEIESQVKNALELVHLEESLHRHPQSHSRGERKRLAVATVLVTQPRVIILDEPTTGQDDKNLQGSLTLMTTLAKQANAAIMMITHDIKIVLRYATRVIVLNEGQIVMEGDKNLLVEQADQLSDLHILPPVLLRLSRKHFPDRPQLMLNFEELEAHLLPYQGH